MFENPVADIVGWMGAALLLTAYAMVSSGRLAGTAVSFQLMNAVGSIGLLINTYVYRAYPSAMVNLVWFGIAATVLIRIRADRARSVK